MKVYRVVIDVDGETTKESGTTSTEINRKEMYFAANSAGDVFNVAIKRAAEEDGEIVAVIEVCPAVTIL